MLDRFLEWLEASLVNLGILLTRLSADDKKKISLFLVSLLMAAVAARLLPSLLIR